jgi:pyruvate formate lyase activating enzyme
MLIGGLEKLSLSDFPGKLAAVVFTLGCNLRCGYCHNPGLVDPVQYPARIPVEDVLSFLSSRRGFLQGVVVSGGEPTIHAGLHGFLREVRSLGFSKKLDTNGTNPACLRELVSAGLLDYVALDVKAPSGSYARITGVDIDTSLVVESLRFLSICGVDHEVRTTYGDTILSNRELRDLAAGLGSVRRFILQGFRSAVTLDPALRGTPSTSAAALHEALHVLESDGVTAQIRS